MLKSHITNTSFLRLHALPRTAASWEMKSVPVLPSQWQGASSSTPHLSRTSLLALPRWVVKHRQFYALRCVSVSTTFPVRLKVRSTTHSVATATQASVRDCASSLDDRAFQAYTQFYTNVHRCALIEVCVHIQNLLLILIPWLFFVCSVLMPDKSSTHPFFPLLTACASSYKTKTS